MRFHTTLTSSAALAALCSLLVVSGGCGGDGTSEGEASGPALHDGELGGAPGNGEDTSGKVTICHVPPGNPANAHTLVVSRQGWENGHQRHRGDSLGACNGSGDGSDGGTSEPDGGTSAPDAGPVCAPVGEACFGDGVTCCGGLQCSDGVCRTVVIIN